MPLQEITIDALVAAPPDKVWDRYIRPEHITQWNFASDDWCCPHASNDLRVGGVYQARMEARDGSFGFDFTSVYSEVVPKERLVHAMEDGRNVTTTFVAEGAGTRVTTTFEAETENDPEMQRAGWQAILNNFKAHAES